jgi:K(+)-stimulated pyrophosphate-energized sodium pump
MSLLIVFAGVIGLFLSLKTYRNILKSPDGNSRVQEIAGQIQKGALTFLQKEFQYLSIYMIAVFFILCAVLGFSTALCFIFGALCSLSASYIGMKAATISNSRTAQAASENNPLKALITAFNGGAVMGLAVASIGLLGLGLLIMIFSMHHLEPALVGFGVGATSVALFARIGGGIYTKAADVGADLVGKVEAGIPEDDPRNPGVIADNVGDNVGDVAGMGADIFESYVNSIVSAAAIGAALAPTILGKLTGATSDMSTIELNVYRWKLLFLPFILALLGLIASYASIIFLRNQSYNEPTKLLQKTILVATGLFLGLAFILFMLMPGVIFSLWFAVVVGAVCGMLIGLIAEYYTSSKPVYRIVNASKTGPATNIIAGLATGFMSAISPLWVIAFAIFFANWIGGIYGVSLAAVGMLATTCIVMTVDAYGPIADNAGGIAEMAYLGEETRAITDKLDAAGNTTAAIGKGFAVCSAALTAISLYGAYSATILSRAGEGKFLDLSLTNPNVTIGALIGASLSCVVASLTMTAVGRAAGQMVEEIRRQFREITGLLEGKEGVKPDVERCVAISTKAALSEMMLPGIISIVVPVIIGFWFGADALGGLLLGTTLTALVLALFMANAGGAWDNAKKFIEQGLIYGEKKGSDAHKAAVVGDTVGDPFKDTSGPSLNILIKLVSMVALLIAPLLTL